MGYFLLLGFLFSILCYGVMKCAEIDMYGASMIRFMCYSLSTCVWIL